MEESKACAQQVCTLQGGLAPGGMEEVCGQAHWEGESVVAVPF